MNILYYDRFQVEGNVAALKEAAINQTYNLEGIRPVTIKEIAERVRELVGDVAIEYKEARPEDYSGAIVSNDRAKKDLEWELKVDFAEGVRRYIEWYKAQLKPHI